MYMEPYTKPSLFRVVDGKVGFYRSSTHPQAYLFARPRAKLSLKARWIRSCINVYTLQIPYAQTTTLVHWYLNKLALKVFVPWLPVGLSARPSLILGGWEFERSSIELSLQLFRFQLGDINFHKTWLVFLDDTLESLNVYEIFTKVSCDPFFLSKAYMELSEWR